MDTKHTCGQLFTKSMPLSPPVSRPLPARTTIFPSFGEFCKKIIGRLATKPGWGMDLFHITILVESNSSKENLDGLSTSLCLKVGADYSE